MPEIKPHVTEYQRHRLACPRCGETTCAELPPGVPTGQAGPRLVALTRLLMGYFRQSKRRTALFLGDSWVSRARPARAVKLQNQATEALRPAYDELAATADAGPPEIDETPTKEGRQGWLWTYVAGAFTVFAVRASRAATA